MGLKDLPQCNAKCVLMFLLVATAVNILVVLTFKNTLLSHSIVAGATYDLTRQATQTLNDTFNNIMKKPSLLLDIHSYVAGKGHVGEASGHPTSNHPHIRPNTIAIGGGITSAKIKPNATMQEMRAKCPIFNVLLPSFCVTCGDKYSYHFYLAYDYTDKLFSNPQQVMVFSEIFHEQVKAKCPSGAKVELHLVQCDHTKKPAWAQNDAMMEAYIDNMEYFYRINDDSKLQKPGWADIFIQRLREFTPANVGVVGPHHHGGNMRILTYDFTHHTHQDMFGFHYPRDFPDWYADDWVTGVYSPGRVEKMKEVPLTHTMQLGQRYKHHFTGNKLKPRFVKDKQVMQRYVNYLETKPGASSDPSKVIAISLHDVNASLTFGALRNVQQAPVFFPEWTVRIYVPHPNVTQNAIPERMLNKMKTLGAQVHYVDKLHYPKESIAFHIINDKSVQAVLIRDPEFRLSDRQKSAVDEWMDSPSMMHCMRDHPSHSALPIVPGLLGIKLAMLRNNAQQFETFSKILEEKLADSISALEKTLWEKYEKVFLCHDSVSGDNWTNSKPFSVPSADEKTYEGQKYDEHMEPMHTESQ